MRKKLNFFAQKGAKLPLCKDFWNFKFGFTLAELLMATLIISIIMVALAPVITRRAHDNIAITVNQKQGLEIFSTPGVYTFDVPVGINTLFLQGSGGGGGGAGATYVDKNLQFLTSQSFTIPRGVREVSLTITGSGGGGGGSNGAMRPDVYSDTEPTETLYNNKCLSDEFLMIRGRSGEFDSCITRNDMYGYVISNTETCSTGGACCWKLPESGAYCSTPTNGIRSGCGRYVCTSMASWVICDGYKRKYSYQSNIYDRISIDEGSKIVNYPDYFVYDSDASGLNLCIAGLSCVDTSGNTTMTLSKDKVPTCNSGSMACKGGGHGDGCYPYSVWLSNGGRLDFCGPCTRYVTGSGNDLSSIVRCSRPLKRLTPYNGAGGASGAKLTRTIKVLPFDVLEISIGNGGTGGASQQNGNQGGTTQVLHKRNGSTIGTYYVKGGLGGRAASTGGHGSAYSDAEANPTGTCYANTNVGCNVLSYSGNVGSSNHGGNGGRVNNSGTINDGSASSGGYLFVDSARLANQRSTTTEQNRAMGQNATTRGWGGGGGMTPNWAIGSEHFFKGGNGAQGVVDISYRIALPGAGGGSATRVGGSKTISGEDKQYEIKYKVQEGSRVVVKIGAGGSGGVTGQDGTNGEPTIVGDNKILFLGGQGATAVTQTQKNNLSNCIGTNTNQYTILGCIDNTSYKSKGGQSGVVGDEDAIKSTTSGLIISSDTTSNVDYSIQNTSYKGQAGWIGSYMLTGFSTPLSYGFHGGSGGTPFGIRDLIPSVTCGGGMSAKYPATGGVATNYICTSGTANANRSKAHDPVNNEFGGSGGGGGGVTDTTSDGEGSAGTSGYLRIRWNEAEQE